jgi:hypothetical protein
MNPTDAVMPKTTTMRWAMLVTLLLVWPTIAAASTTRINSLGGSGSFFEDDHNVLRWCGSLGDYPDLAIIETGHFDLTNGYDDDWGKTVSGPGGGVHARFDEAGRWGTGGLYFHGQADDSDPGSLHRSQLEGSVTGLYAREIAGVSAGLFLRHTVDTDFRYNNPAIPSHDVVFERGRSDIGLGARFDIATNAYCDLAGEIRHISERAYLDDPVAFGWDTGSFDSWSNYGLRGRAFIGLGDRLALTPLLEYISEDFTGTSFAGAGLAGETSDNAGRLFRIGAGLNFFVDADNLLLFSTEFIDGRMDHTIYDLDRNPDDFWQEDYTVFLMRLAFETRLAHWVTVRASTGYENLDNRGDLPNPASGAHIPLGLGVGLHVGSLVLDLALTDREPRGLSRYSATLPAVESSTWLSMTLSYGF